MNQGRLLYLSHAHDGHFALGSTLRFQGHDGVSWVQVEVLAADWAVFIQQKGSIDKAIFALADAAQLPVNDVATVIPDRVIRIDLNRLLVNPKDDIPSSFLIKLPQAD